MNIKNAKEKTFANWIEDELRLTFGLRPKYDCKQLEKWLSVEHDFTEFEHLYIKMFLRKIKTFIYTWNEAELRANFIDPITALIQYDSSKYFIKAFSERSITATLNKTELKGKVDWMIATGQSTPQHPFFFIHEYKKELGDSNDPLAQLLAAMLAAHTLHQIPPVPNLLVPEPVHYYKNLPIYGCYIIGRNWFFVTLEDNRYCVSKAYDATEEDELYQIMNALKTQKVWIYQTLEQNVGVEFA